MLSPILSERRSFGPDTEFGPHNEGNGLITLVHSYASRPSARPHMKECVEAALMAGNPFRPDAKGETAIDILQKHGLQEHFNLG